MTKNEYNGWTNYETWCVNLWIDSEESSQTYWNEQADFLVSDAGQQAHKPRYVGSFTPTEVATFALAEQLKDEHSERFMDASEEKLANTVFADLMNAALSEVNWQEIAKHLIDGAMGRQSVKDGRIYAS